MRIQFIHTFEDIVSMENLLEAWSEFVRGKRSRKDVQAFEQNLMSNVILLHHDLVAKRYCHAPYTAFNISDPKPRNIHKATVRDRLLHHAIYRILYPFFDRVFIADSFSCRKEKGTHKALARFQISICKTSRNNTTTCWVLKCDIRKFFANIDQDTLFDILRKYIPDQDILWLLERVVYSFSSGTQDKGLPLGNLTSQLLVNIYMNEFDQFVKHKLKAKYYIRYADDFVIFSENQERLIAMVPPIREFLQDKLKLELHPQKLSIKTLASGVGFLGWVHFPDHRVLRTGTKRRMMKRIAATEKEEVIASYRGLLKHGNAYKISMALALRDRKH